jgi:hypothetical protein
MVRPALTTIVVAAVAATAHADASGGAWRAWNRSKAHRTTPTLTVLADGRVLLAGGGEFAPKPPVPPLEHSAEVLDPRTGIGSLTDPMAGHRVNYAVAPLPSGGALLAGGFDHTKLEWPRRRRGGSYEGPPGISASLLSSAQSWDPVRGWRDAGAMAEKRTGARAAALPDGRVLVTGGFQTTYGPSYVDPSIVTNGNRRFLASAEVWSPATNRWRPVAPMSQAREGHTATTLADGRVLVIGGTPGETAAGPTAAPAEIWTPANGAWRPIARPRQERAFHTATRLADGRVLITGGTPLRRPFASTPQPLASAELWDPVADRWTDVAPMRNARSSHDAVLLTDGRVLVAGGSAAPGEIWDPTTDGWTPTPAFTEPMGVNIQLAALRDGRALAVSRFAVQLWTP